MDLELLMDALKDRPIDEISHEIKENIVKWKSTALNIGVAGVKGSGKSSLINLFRGLHPSDENAAKTGMLKSDSNSAPVQYPFPDNENIILWDLPGLDNLNDNVESYLEGIKCERYDFFLICSKGRFHLYDYLIADQLNQRNKHFYFVKTHIDKDVEDEIENYQLENSWTQEHENIFIEKIKQDILEQITDLKNLENKEKLIYVLSTRLYHSNKFEYPRLLNDILSNLDGEKKHSLLLTLNHLPKEIIQIKKDLLKSRIAQVALISAAGGAMPIPGVSLVADLTVMAEEIYFYKKQLGISNQSLDNYSKDYNIPRNELEEFLNVTTKFSSLITNAHSIIRIVHFVSKYLPFYAFSNTVQNAIKVIPGGGSVVGSIIGCPLSYGTTYYCLNCILDDFIEASLELQSFCMNYEIIKTVKNY